MTSLAKDLVGSKNSIDKNNVDSDSGTRSNHKLNIIREMKLMCPFSAELLKLSNAAKCLKQCRDQDDSPSVVSAAADLIQKWKTLFNEYQEGLKKAVDADKDTDESHHPAESSDIESISTWQQLFIHCETREQSRMKEFADRSKNKAVSEMSSRHCTQLLPARSAVMSLSSAGNHGRTTKYAASHDQNATTVLPGGVKLFQKQQQIKSGLNSSSFGLVHNTSTGDRKRQMSTATLMQSTKKMKVVETKNGGILTMPRQKRIDR